MTFNENDSAPDENQLPHKCSAEHTRVSLSKRNDRAGGTPEGSSGAPLLIKGKTVMPSSKEPLVGCLMSFLRHFPALRFTLKVHCFPVEMRRLFRLLRSQHSRWAIGAFFQCLLSVRMLFHLFSSMPAIIRSFLLKEEAGHFIQPGGGLENALYRASSRCAPLQLRSSWCPCVLRCSFPTHYSVGWL